MDPIEFLIPRRPVSQQARRRSRRREWVEFVARRAREAVGPDHEPVSGPVAVQLLYLYDEIVLDVDNILKPIHDALIGIVFDDDAAVTDVELHRRWRGTPFALESITPMLETGIGLGQELVYVRVTEAPRQDVLP